LKKDIQIEELTTELENTVELLSQTQKGFCSDVKGMQTEYSRHIAKLERENSELRERNDNQRNAMESLLIDVERLQRELESKPFGVLRSESLTVGRLSTEGADLVDVQDETHPELILTPRNDIEWNKTSSSQHSQISHLPGADKDPAFVLLLDFEENTPETPKGWDSV